MASMAISKTLSRLITVADRSRKREAIQTAVTIIAGSKSWLSRRRMRLGVVVPWVFFRKPALTSSRRSKTSVKTASACSQRGRELLRKTVSIGNIVTSSLVLPHDHA